MLKRGNTLAKRKMKSTQDMFCFAFRKHENAVCERQNIGVQTRRAVRGAALWECVLEAKERICV